MVRRVVGASIAGLCVLWFIITGIFNFWVFYNLPSVPNPTNGETYKMASIHGAVRFGSEGEFSIQQVMLNGMSIAALVFILNALIGLSSGLSQRQGEAPPEVKGLNKPPDK